MNTYPLLHNIHNHRIEKSFSLLGSLQLDGKFVVLLVVVDGMKHVLEWNPMEGAHFVLL